MLSTRLGPLNDQRFWSIPGYPPTASFHTYPIHCTQTLIYDCYTGRAVFVLRRSPRSMRCISKTRRFSSSRSLLEYARCIEDKMDFLTYNSSKWADRTEQMKSTEVYRIIREVIGPWCKTHGFKRTKGGMLGWYKPVGTSFLVFWFQCGPRHWDDFEGSGFIVEFQASDEPVIGQGGPGCKRERLPELLNDEQLENLRRIQNRVIAQLSPPPKTHPVFQISPEYTRMVLKEFQPVAKNALNIHQFWHRYYTVEDVRRWAALILDLLPDTLKRFAPDVSL